MDKMTEETRGRGYKLALLKASSLNERPSPLQSVVKNIQEENDLSGNELRQPLEPKLCGRGKIMAKIISQTKQNNEVHTASDHEKTIGRGTFLAQIEKQIKLKESLGWSNLDTEGVEKRKTVKRKPVSPKTEILTENLKELSFQDNVPPISKQGESGEPMKCMTNYVRLKVDPASSVYEYEITFKPDIDFAAFRYKLVNKHFRTRRGINCYDGGSKLFLPEKITDDEMRIETTQPNGDTSVILTVKFLRQMTMGECQQLYNVLFNNCAKVLKFARLGRNSYDFRQSHQIPQHKLEIWPGFVTSVKEFDGGLLLCCDVKHRVLRTETAYDVLSNIAKFDANNFRSLVLRELLGQCVLTRYNNNLYRIDDVDWKQSPLSKFKLSSGEEMTFLEYYKKQYNLEIMDLKQPLLLSKQKDKNPTEKVKLICLVPEICHMTGLTDKMRNDMRVMKDIAEYMRVTPVQRHLSFRKFLENIKNNSNAQEMLKEWGLTIDDGPLETEGRVLPWENILLKDKVKVPVPPNTSWGNLIKNNGLIRSVDLKHWILIHTQKDSFLACRFKESVKKVGIGLGMMVDEPQMVPLKNDKIESYVQGLRESISSETQLVVCLCPTARTDRYSAIKKFCCRENPVASQVINSSTITRANRLMPVAQNITLQINNKLGGASWAVHIPLKNCMICGIDTYHELGGNSVGAFVASLDSDYTTWFSKTCIQEPKQELLDGLVRCFIAGLKRYFSINKVLPSRIVVFRDGVGDGMLWAVKSHEVMQFLDACRLVDFDYKPKLSFVLVSKRINTKFYQIMAETGSLSNPLPGSVLDHTVTKKNYYDFFLVSQHVSCGTATPSHYIVIYDNSELKPDHMQRLTYKFCHLYYNWAGTVRVPAPCLYAHKLAYLVGQNIKGPASESLEDKLFYL